LDAPLWFDGLTMRDADQFALSCPNSMEGPVEGRPRRIKRLFGIAFLEG